MARRKTGDKKPTGKEVDIPKVQADDHSIAFEELHVGGNVGGDIRIGHTIGYTADQVSVLLKQITTTLQPKKFDGRCPYKGLEVFEEEDAELFFGRERLVNELVGRVKESRTVFITGPSGSGKSSLVRAGLIHALRKGAIKGSERWLFETMKPGREPLKDLALAFSRLKSPELQDYFLMHLSEADILDKCAESVLSGKKDQRFVLFVDQFEEIFTQINSEEERVAFINMLAHAGTIENGRVIVLFAMRSDFVSNCATYPLLNELLSQEFRQIGAMQPDELVSAIALPARHVGLPIEDELIARIINDMKGEPDALPLMQFALKDLFDAQQAEGGFIALTLKDYLKHGGIQQSLERHADATFAKLSESEQELTRSIFSGLIEIGRGTQDTKRTALFDELIPANAKSENVLAIVQKLADARLVITDEQAGKDTVTISHEKLIEAWPWLKKLVNENRDVISLQNEIASDAKEWEEHERDISYLYTGARLANALEQLQSKKLVLSDTANQFVQAGNTQQDLGRRTQKKRSTFLWIGIVIAIITMSFLSYTAIRQASNAKEQLNIAIARQLASQARTILVTSNSRQITAILLAIQSMKLFPLDEAAQILQSNTLARFISGITYDRPVSSVAFSPDSLYVVSGSWDATVRVWEVTTGKEIARVTHNASVGAVAFSPNGKYIISGGDDGTARVCESLTGKEIALMRHNDFVSSVIFSSDGKYVASGSADKTARIWEPLTGEEIARMIHEGPVNTIAFSPSGQYIASGSDDGTARVWESLTGKEIARIIHEGPVNIVAFSSDGKWVVSGSTDGTARIWAISTGIEIVRMNFDAPVSDVALSPEGQYAVSGSGNTVSVWDVKTGKELTQMSHDDHIESVAFSPDGKYVMSGSQDNTALVWEALTGEEIERIIHDDYVLSVAFSPDGKYIVSGSWDKTARVWEMTNHKESMQIFHDDVVNSVALSPDGKYVVSASDDNTVRIWEFTNRKEIARMIHDGFVESVAFSPNSKYVVSGSCSKYTNVCVQGSVRVWEASTGNENAHMTHDGSVESVAFSPNSEYVVSGSRDSTVRVLEVATGKETAHMEHNDYVTSVAFSPDGKYIVSGSWDKTARVWEVISGNEIANMTHDGLVESVAFSPNSKYVVSVSIDGTARLWETATGKEITHMTHEDQVSSFSFSPDGEYVVSGSYDGTARVWEAATGQEIARMTHNDTGVSTVAFSPDGKYVVSGAHDGTASVWVSTTGQEIIHLTHENSVSYVAFSPNGKYIVSGSRDNTVRVWIWQTEDLITDACSRVNRNLTYTEWDQYIGMPTSYEAVCPNLPIEPEPTPTLAP
jgi:WD40 repeat protein